MAEDKPVHLQVEDLMNSWNPPTKDNSLESLVGVPVEKGDGSATAHVRDPRLDHDRNAGRDDLDAQKFGSEFKDDGDDDRLSPDDYADAGKKALQAEVDARNEGRSDEDKISRSGSKSDLVERLEEDDKSNSADDGDGDDAE